MTNSDLLATNSSNKELSSTPHASPLSTSETKQVLTPFAFEIDKSLFGLPLSKPWKRAVALLIDFFLIAILAETPGELLAVVAAITFFKLGGKKEGKGFWYKLGRFLLRFFGAILVFIVLASTLSEVVDSVTGNNKPTSKVISSSSNDSGVKLDPTKLGVSGTIATAAIAATLALEVKELTCKETSCWYDAIKGDVNALKAIPLPNEKIIAVVKGILEETTITEQQQVELLQQLALNGVSAKENQNEEGSKTDPMNSSEIAEPELKNKKTEVAKEKANKAVKKNDDSLAYRGLEWAQGIIDDLGLSFGWAALYFSVLTAWWKGQTPGKKLMKIRVIQLDGTPLSVWDSFGRYGGYGAGLATGLLGFLQVYWDPNRQAIHDKISATIVIDLTRIDEQT